MSKQNKDLRNLNEEVNKDKELYSGEDTIKNPVGEFWDINVEQRFDPEGKSCFVIQFEYKLHSIRGKKDGTPKKTEIDEVLLYTKGKEVLVELMRIGYIDEISLKSIKEYVGYLKKNGIYDEIAVPSVEISINVSKNIEQKSKECYKTVLDDIENSPESFLISEDGYSQDGKEGIVMNNYKGNSGIYLVIKGEELKEIIDIKEKNDFESIIRCWKNEGLILNDDRPNRFTRRHKFKREKNRESAYVIKINDAIYNRLKQIANGQ